MKLEKMEEIYDDIMFKDEKQETDIGLLSSTKNLMSFAYKSGEAEGKRDADKEYWKGFVFGSVCCLVGTIIGDILRNRNK